MALDRLRFSAPMARIGLGLAAVGRPGYINVGRELPPDRSVPALRRRTHELLDAAYARGVRYVDAARSYGRAEEFLGEWLRARPDALDIVVGSKWGYTYTAGWRVDAEVHETKDHGAVTFERQRDETRAVLGGRLDLYQIHSVTPDSPALTDRELHARLADLAAAGVTIGLSVSGPGQPEAIRVALAIQVGGEPLFRSAQATWNVLEPAAGPALVEWHAAGRFVIVKEALANGRLAESGPEIPDALDEVAHEIGAARDSVALAAVLRQPWADVVLSGASTPAQLDSNLAGAGLTLDPTQMSRLSDLAQPSAEYWRHRSALAWT